MLAAFIGAAPASTRANPLTARASPACGSRATAASPSTTVPSGIDYFVPMIKEDGEWKVGALGPSEFS